MFVAEARPTQVGPAPDDDASALLPEPYELVPLGQGLFPTSIAHAFALPSVGGSSLGMPGLWGAMPQMQPPQPVAGAGPRSTEQASQRGAQDAGAGQVAATVPSASWPPNAGPVGPHGTQQHPGVSQTTGGSSAVNCPGAHQQQAFASAPYPMYMPYPGGVPGRAAYAMPGMMGGNQMMQFGAGMHGAITDHNLYTSLSYSGGAPSSSGAPQYMRMGGSMTETTEEDYGDGARAVKRSRLVWTPQLHKRFEEAVTKLGPEKSIPKNIMQEMNVEGLTRENVASHLQKYRLQKKVTGKDDTAAKTASDTPA